MINIIKRLATKNKATEKTVYIIYLFYTKMIKLLYIWMKICPVKKNKIVCCTGKGKRYGDNPMYISNVLQESKKYEIVWLLKENIKENIPKEVKRVKYNWLTEIFHLSTAKVWIDSELKYAGFLKRKEQLYVQTWHGSYGLKKIAFDLNEKIPLIAKKEFAYNEKLIDIMISNSKRTTEIYRRAFRYKGEVLEVGSPRNDMLFVLSENIRCKVDDFFDCKSKKIVLYAPTFRNNYRTDDFRLDYAKLRQSLENKFGGEWVILVRLHPNNLSDAKDFIAYNENVKNASDYSIMQELLLVSDILITDYSSCMFDFVTVPKPCFIYATDVERYKEERDNYFELEELPFPVATNNDELSRVIEEFDNEQYLKDLEQLKREVGLCESGTASKQVAEYIEKWIEKH